ncbi:ABC transporter ATP-binding protein [Plantactinospora sp. WMMB334]|uniref:ABC transporter ATP-binding protein n=1 Tax=Plantactinospora sp. WMMB334 TaxID=3404119 RepID=UPI003B9580B3
MLSRRLLGLAAGRRAGLAVLVLLGVAITGSYAGQGLLIAHVLVVILDGRGLGAAVVALAGALGLQAVRAVLLWAREVLAATVAGRTKEDLRGRLLDKLFTLGPGYTLGVRTGQVQSVLVDGVEALERYFSAFLPQLGAAAVGAVGLIGYVCWLDPVVGITIAGCGLGVVAAPRISRRVMDAPMRRWLADYRGLYADTIDALQGMVTLKGINAHRRRGVELSAQSARFARTSTRLVAAAAAYEVVVGVAAAAGTTLAVGIGALRAASGAIDVATLLVILLLSRECFRPLTDVGKAFHAAYPGLAAAENVFAFLDETPTVVDQATHSGGGRTARRREGPPRVDLDEVTFAYHADAPAALSQVSLTARPGTRTALVGRSGAGKTTVVSLLLRLFDPQHGAVRIDGDDVRDLPLPVLRSMIAVVSQDTYLFHGTVRDNLLLARPDAAQAAVEGAARAAMAHEFITALPDGYDTMVGERGARLSGGERQRLAIARALLKDAPILILDEATSAVDAANEAGIQAALEQLTAHRTTLVIAHRMSTVRSADHVVVLDGGRVVEHGRPDELLAAGTVYHHLVTTQAGTT